MITFVGGSIFDSGCDTLVNPVNCHGVMGKGLAAAFKKRFPLLYAAYARACADGELQPGGILLWENQAGLPRYVVNLATKDHWRQPSQLTWIEAGLRGLSALAAAQLLGSIAIPALGCGLGGLSWASVRPLLVAFATSNPDLSILAYTAQ